MSAVPQASQDLARAAALAAAPAVRLIRGDAVALEPVRWLWPGFLPAGMLTILGGAPGCGKTTIALSLVATVSSGEAWPDGQRHEQPGDVMIWSGEDAHAVLAARLAAMGADMQRIHFIDGLTNCDCDAFAALARLVLVAAKVKADEDGEPRRVLVRAKSNIGPDDGGFAYSLDRVEVAPEVEGQRVLWLEALEGSARDLLAEAEADPDGDAESSALDEAIHFLRSELRDGPKPAKAIFKEARDAGHSERTVKRAKSELQAESVKEKAGWVWALPVKGANSAKGAKVSSGQNPGTVAKNAKDASESPLENLGTLGALGILEDAGEVL